MKTIDMRNIVGAKLYVGTEAERAGLGLSGVVPGSEFLVASSGNRYLFDGQAWILISTGGSINVSPQDTTQSGTTAERIAAVAADPTIKVWDDTTLGDRTYKDNADPTGGPFGDGWKKDQTLTDGAGDSHIKSSDVPFPQNTPLKSTNIALSNVASGTAAWISPDLSGFSCLVFEIKTAPTGTTPALRLYPSYNDSDYAATAIAIVNLATGAIIAGTTGFNAVGIFAVVNPLGGGIKATGYKMVLTGGAADLSLPADSIRFLAGSL